MRWPVATVVLLGYGFHISPTAAAEPTPKSPDLIAGLIEALDDPIGEVRQNIAVALANLGEPALPSLLAALNDPKPERRMGAAVAIGQIRPAARTAAPALLQAMKDKNPEVRRHVSYALSRVVDRESIVPPSGREPLPNIAPIDPLPSSTTPGAR